VNKKLDELLISGGDERLTLKENGKNKYFINPLEYKGLLLRGSCTCNPLNSFSYPAIMDKFNNENVDFIKIREEQRNRISSLFNFENEDKFDVIFAPSGSDLPYLPLLFSKFLYPEKDLKLLLTCPEELGSGSQLAFLGKNYSHYMQFGKTSGITEDINPLFNVSMERFMARSRDGNVKNNKEAIADDVANEKSKSIIGALVIGSKSGIEDDISIIPDVSSEVMWAVDLCQIRNSKRLVNDLLDKGCLVMITGSKFYMSPPFSGAILVPKSLSKKLNAINVDSIKQFVTGYNQVFSKYDFPESWSDIRELFSPEHNDGLVVRWEAALELMERFDSLPREKSKKIISDWNATVRENILQSNHLQLMPQQDKTNQTIVSFKVKSKDGSWLNYDQLKVLHKKITDTPFVFEKFTNVLIGQPVRYSHGAFLRFAIGAYNILKISGKEDANRFTVDELLIKHIDKMID
jgi:hypothetical protein